MNDDGLFHSWLISDDFSVDGVIDDIPNLGKIRRQNRQRSENFSIDEIIETNENNAATKEKVSEEKIKEQLYNERIEFLKKWINSSNKIILPKNIRQHIKDKHLEDNQISFIRSLPWWEDSALPPYSFNKAEELLNQNHFGLEKVKKNILEYVDLKATLPSQGQGLILLLNGPAGVGKTSIAKSISIALGKPFKLVKLGGMSSSRDINGYEKNWKTPQAGAIARAIKESGSFSPVILLDEIDKIGVSKEHGTPYDALLYILDSDNTEVIDNYLEIPIDLSKIIFIATSNDKSKIDPILLDRMEIIDIRAYDFQEKKQIAKEYSLKKLKTLYELTDGQLDIKDEAIEEILRAYAIEAGVRNLNRYLNKICRFAKIEKSKGGGKLIVDKRNLRTIIGEPIVGQAVIHADNIVGNIYVLDFIGDQGEVRCIQASAVLGKGQILCFGPVSQEVKDSVNIAISHIKRYAYKYKISVKYFDKIDIHLNFMNNKNYNGYDLGFAIVLAILSAIYGKPISNSIAVAGKLTLDGSIINVSNIIERIACAISRDGIKTIFIPKNDDEEKPFADLLGIDKLKIIEVEKLQNCFNNFF